MIAAMSTDVDLVRAANETFYSAFRARDPDAMDRLWARAAAVTCIHPGWNALHGRAPVIESLRRILRNPQSPAIACSDVAVSIYGESALVICREGVVGQPAVLVATNVFIREDSAWRMVHHQAGPTAPAAPPPAPNRSLN